MGGNTSLVLFRADVEHHRNHAPSAVLTHRIWIADRGNTPCKDSTTAVGVSQHLCDL